MNKRKAHTILANLASSQTGPGILIPRDVQECILKEPERYEFKSSPSFVTLYMDGKPVVAFPIWVGSA